MQKVAELNQPIGSPAGRPDYIIFKPTSLVNERLSNLCFVNQNLILNFCIRGQTLQGKK